MIMRHVYHDAVLQNWISNVRTRDLEIDTISRHPVACLGNDDMVTQLELVVSEGRSGRDV